MNRKESISAIVLLTFSVAVCYQARRYPFGNMVKVGPGFLPFYLGVVLAILSAIILFKTILAPTDGPGGIGLTKTKFLRVALVFFAMVAYAFLLGKLGFPITTFLFTLFLFKFIESHGWMPSISGALGTSIANYLIFDFWLHGQFPKGFLGL